ncbi:MAG: DUF1836 domain-containing protein [Eggerthellaceae bacterium]|nr:DUF1836 domain-containing protein [Eggerthellaceae bacterium]
MDVQTKQIVIDSMEGFSLPRYRELPGVGLYLEQVVQFVNTVTAPLGLAPLTGSMVGNYVKQGLIESPAKKRYGADQLAYLIFITITKNVLSIENLRLFISMQKQTYDVFVAYDYFCEQFELALDYAFGRIESLEDTGVTVSEEKAMLRYCTIATANVAYLGKCFDAVRVRAAAEE